MPAIFLSYRRNDTGGYAGRLADALEARFGTGSVFQDTLKGEVHEVERATRQSLALTRAP